MYGAKSAAQSTRFRQLYGHKRAYVMDYFTIFRSASGEITGRVFPACT